MRFWSTRLPESFRSFIDMGVQDGSIPTAYPEEAAQLLSLLGNYWLMPCFYPADHAGMEHRIRCLVTMLDAIGVLCRTRRGGCGPARRPRYGMRR